MKKYIFYIVLVFTLSLGACNDWLDVPSKTEVIDYEMFESEQGFMDAMAGVYNLMGGEDLYGDMLSLTFLDMLAQRYDVESSAGSNIGGLGENLYEPGFYEKQEIVSVVDEVWRKGYNVIANVNSLLEQIESRKSVFTYDNYQMIKGEALGVRAFMHFDLMRMFGKAYHLAGDELTIPYVTKLSGKEWPLFCTQDQIIGLALRDLQQADSLLTSDDLYSSSVENSWVNSRRSHFNRWAVYATMARIYHWKGDTENALLYANKVIDSKQFAFYTSQNDVGNKKDVAYYEECIFSLYKEELPDVYKDRFNTVGSNMLYNSHENIEALYDKAGEGGTDYRLNLWYLFQDADSERKWSKYERYNTSVAKNPNLITLIRLSEMYYIAAECFGNTKEGHEYLNTIRENRGLRHIGENMPDENFEEEIQKEYRKEFISEGQLFYYYKRLNKKSILKADSKTYADMETLGYVFPIPKEELDLRGGIIEE